MAEVNIPELVGIKPFDLTGDPTSVGSRWKRWMKSFTLYADSKGLIIVAGKEDHKVQKRALLLHTAGEEVQKVVETLPDVGEAKDYDKLVKVLDEYFIPQVNSTYQNYLFRCTEQKENESIAQFVTRLRQAVKDCDYGDQSENQIRDQVVHKCRSVQLRKKLLEEGEKLQLKDVLRIAATQEAVQSQLNHMKDVSTGSEATVNSVQARKFQAKGGHDEKTDRSDRQADRSDKRKVECYGCGKKGHYSRDPQCPAKGKTCNHCGKTGHFANKCREKNRDGKVNFVESEADEYAFSVMSRGHTETVEVTVGGRKIPMLIDSGASANIIDKELWNSLKEKRIRCTSRKSNKKLYAYGSEKPLRVLGSFTALASIGDSETQAEFIVIDGTGEPLLGRGTASELGVLKIGANVMSVNEGVAVMDKYKEVFEGVGKLKDYQLKLHIDPNVTPVAQQVRRIPYSLKDKVKEKIDELVELDIIEPVEGPTPWVSPVVVVPKADGEIRLCVDMRRANEAIIRERHPIPHVDDVLHSLNQSTVFSKLDLKWGYHQVELEPESRSITTFVTHCGLYRYKRLMFGINAAPEIYQHVIQQTLQNCDNTANISDDIIVHAKSVEEHDRALEQVLKTLKEKNLTLNKDKCQLHMSQLEFMGFVLSERGIGPTEEKVKAVVNAREPENASEVRSFLGLVNYNARFIPDYATITEPLRELTKNGVPFVFGKEQKRAFAELKTRLGQAETLAYFDIDAKTRVITDASPVGLGAILSQEHDGEYKVVSYASRSLTAVETRYSQTEKEALAIVWACERFNVYLYGLEFELCTDHKPLETIYSPKSKPCARIERWVLRLQPYKFKVIYIPGKDNVADSLSRLMQTGEGGSSPEETAAEEFVRFVAITATPQAMTTREVEEASAEDEELCELRECIKTGQWKNSQCKEYIPASGELCVVGKLILRGTRIVIPRKLRPHILTLAHEGHLGVVSMKQRLRSKVWWPGITNDAERFCKTCHGCQLVGQPTYPEPIKSTPLPSGPWQDLALDFLGPLPSGHSVLTVIDYYSRYYEIAIMKSTTTENVIESLDEIFSRHGLPLTLSSDNGPQFASEMFRQYLSDHGIKHRRVTPLWPQANGEIERQNRSLLKRMRIAQAEGKDWKKEVRTYLTAYRATPHTTTGVSPAELLFGRKMRTKLPDIQEAERAEEFKDRDAEMKMKAKLYADERRHAEDAHLNPGDKVLIKQNRENKLTTTFAKQPYQVISKEGNSVVVESPQGVQYQRNVTHVKKYLTTSEHPQGEEDKEVATEETWSNTQDKKDWGGTSSVIQPDPPPRPVRARQMPSKFEDFDMR